MSRTRNDMADALAYAFAPPPPPAPAFRRVPMDGVGDNDGFWEFARPHILRPSDPPTQDKP